MANSDLKKNLNTLDVLSVAFGAMIGWAGSCLLGNG